MAETIGLWFLNQKVVVPPNRLEALNWCYQISIATFIIYLISVPYNAAIIAHERMSVFAYIGIFESIGKLLIAYLVLVSPIDRLCFYALLMCILSAAIRLVYGWYCKEKFEECRYSWILDKELLIKMFGFAGWNSIGAISWVLRLHGGTLLVNLFFGPSANAAKSIGNRVSTVVSSFSANFMTAINPQITKSYANGDRDYMLRLAYKGIRFSFFLILMLALPVLINTYYILYLWLKLVPDSAPIFVQLSIVMALTEVLSSPLITMMLATGTIKKYQIIVGGLQMLNFPVAYLTFKMGAPVESIMIVAIILSMICLAARLVLLKGMIGLDPWQYITDILLKVLLVTIISVSTAYYVNTLLEQNFLNVVLVSIFTMIVVAITSFLIGCTNSEQRLIIDKISAVASKIIK